MNFQYKKVKYYGIDNRYEGCLLLGDKCYENLLSFIKEDTDRDDLYLYTGGEYYIYMCQLPKNEEYSLLFVQVKEVPSAAIIVKNM